MNAFRVAVLIASLIVVNGEPQDSEDREVTSLNSLQNSQAPAYNALPAQSYGSPYGYQQPYGGYGYQQPQMYQPQMYQPQPPMPMYPQSQPQYPNYGGNMNYGYPPVGGAVYQPPVSAGGSVSGKPDYEMSGDFTTGSVPSNTPGVIVQDGSSSNPGLNWNDQGSNGGLNWQGNTGGLNWQGNQPGFNFGPPNWQQSFTPISNGCYNRCKPTCSFRPPPRPLPMPIRPRPRPPMPRPQPMPMPRPVMGCRQTCRPMCNQTPTCGGGSQFNGNTMVCGSTKPNYGFGGMGNYGGNYGYGYNYGNQMQTYAQPQVAQQVAKEEPQAEAEEED